MAPEGQLSVAAASSPRLLRAINTAAWAHRNHTRKGTDLPYVSHVFGVMNLVSTVSNDEDVLIAALFHDILEDVPEEYPESQMREDFGDRVVELVRGVTKNESITDWQERADAYLAHLSTADEGSVIISVADKLHNLLSILADHEEIGGKIWERFNSGKEKQQWWYGAVSEVAAARIPGNPLLKALEERVTQLRAL